MSFRLRRQLVILLILTFVTSIYLNGTRIITSFSDRQANSSFLSNLNYFAPVNTWTSLLFGSQNQWGSMAGYLGLSTEYDMKRNYGLTNSYDEARYHQAFSALAQNAFSQWQNYQVRKYGKIVYNTLDEGLGLQELRANRSPAMVAGAVVAALYTGRTVRYRLSSDMSMESKTSMGGPSQFDGQYLGWRSASLDIAAGASYSTSSQSAVFSVQKRLTQEVSVNYDHSDENSIGVSYSKGF